MQPVPQCMTETMQIQGSTVIPSAPPRPAPFWLTLEVVGLLARECASCAASAGQHAQVQEVDSLKIPRRDMRGIPADTPACAGNWWGRGCTGSALCSLAAKENLERKGVGGLTAFVWARQVERQLQLGRAGSWPCTRRCSA